MKKLMLLLVFIVTNTLSIPVSRTRYYSNRAPQTRIMSEKPHISLNTKCEMCTIVVQAIHNAMEDGTGKEKFVEAADYICSKFKFIIDKFISHRVCVLAVKEWKDVVWEIAVDSVIQPNEMCGLIYGPACANTTKFYPSWNITIPGRTELTPTSSRAGVQVGRVGGNMKVLHISDTHLDNNYMVGAKADCHEPLCCTKQNGKAAPGEPAAGRYGFAGKCDTPLFTLHMMFQHMHQYHQDADYIIWTGDVPPHDVWNQSQASQKMAIHQAFDIFRHYFPNHTVFPAIGNHEGVPVDEFPAPEIWNRTKSSSDWLYQELAADWGQWLPKECVETIRKGGYYTTLVRKGLRIVSLNTNYGHMWNFWLLLMSEDPAHQLEWLVGVLLEAERNNEKVHIIGHIPPGTEELHWWSYNFYRIVNRFQHTITSQFYGHTHHDEFRIFYDLPTFTKPINIAYVGPSVTTYAYLNPGYRVYELDSGSANSSLSVVDHGTYILDLEKVLMGAPASFELEYSAKTAYKLKDLSPASWDNLLFDMEADSGLFDIFYSAFTKQHEQGPCDQDCRDNYICTMKKALSGQDFCSKDKLKQLSYLKWFSQTYNKC